MGFGPSFLAPPNFRREADMFAAERSIQKGREMIFGATQIAIGPANVSRSSSQICVLLEFFRI
jgi:hypothetical protein